MNKVVIHVRRQFEVMLNDGEPDTIRKIMDWIDDDGGDTAVFNSEYPDRFMIHHHETRILYSVRSDEWVVKLKKGLFISLGQEAFTAFAIGLGSD